MQFIPSEQWLNAIGEAAMTDAFIAEGGKPGFRTEAIIRRIQANALHYAVYFIRQQSPSGFVASLQLQQLANQLDGKDE